MIINLKNNTFKKVLITILFIFLCSFSVLVYAKCFDKLNPPNRAFYSSSIDLFRIIVSIILLYVFSKFLCNKGVVGSNTNAGVPFLLTYIAAGTIVILIFLNKILISNLTGLIVQASLLAIMLFLSFMWKIKVTDFFHKIKLRELLIIILIFLAYIIPRVILWGKPALRYYTSGYLSIWSYLVNSIFYIIYPGFFEEFLFRGLLISKLKTYKLSDHTINIIQSILFGLTHFNLYAHSVPLRFAVLGTGTQMLVGYILGEIYFKTKSLTPCIIFHVLVDWV